MLDFGELQEFPKIYRRATKSDFICDLMGTQNHHKTLYFPLVLLSMIFGLSPWQLDYYGQNWGQGRVWVRVVNMFGVMVMVRVNTAQNINPDP